MSIHHTQTHVCLCVCVLCVVCFVSSVDGRLLFFYCTYLSKSNVKAHHHNKANYRTPGRQQSVATAIKNIEFKNVSNCMSIMSSEWVDMHTWYALRAEYHRRQCKSSHRPQTTARTVGWSRPLLPRPLPKFRRSAQPCRIIGHTRTRASC